MAGTLSISSVCSIITTASAPRGTTPPVAMVVAVPGLTSTFGAWPQAITSALSESCFGASSARARGVGGAQREAVDIGAVERRHVDRRGEIGGQHAAERRGKAHALGGQGRAVDMALEALARLFRRDDFEELLLPRGGADRGEQLAPRGDCDLRCSWPRPHDDAAPSGWPSLSAGMRIQPSALISACSGR